MTETADHMHEDNKPWYKQFWPWFLIVLPATVVVAGISTVIFAFKHADVVVRDNYYKEGLAINAEFADIATAKQLHLNAQLTVDQDTITLSLSSDPTELNWSDKNLMLELHHPLDEKQDEIIELINSGNNLYRGNWVPLNKGRWYLDLYPRMDNPLWRIKQEVYFPQTQFTVSAQ